MFLIQFGYYIILIRLSFNFYKKTLPCG